MEYGNINEKNTIFSLDIGTRSVIGTVGIIRDKKFNVVSEKYIEHQERAMIDGQIHDISEVANAVKHVKHELEKELDFKLKEVAIAAAGRFLKTSVASINIDIEEGTEIDKDVIRSLELTAVKIAENDIKDSSKGKLYCVGYSIKNYYLNGFVIQNLLGHKGENIGVEVIATFLPRSVVDSLYAVMNKAELEVMSLTLEPIAAIEAVIPQNLRMLNLALVDIGAGTSDIAISSQNSISGYGMVPVAGDEVTEAISQSLLVDFNTAEQIKKQCNTEEEITYVDVIGLENVITREELLKIIAPVIEKFGEEISKAIVELNGGKSPNAVFLVGGGAHTPGLIDVLVKKLNLDSRRIAIKDRMAIVDCICKDNELGSIGVTVLGIALVAIKRRGNDFINVNLNDSVVSLFNSHNHTVADALVQGGINPKLLMGKNGKNIRFLLNGIKRVSFGTFATSSKILINGASGTLESEIREGDNIEIIYAEDGKEASPKVLEYVHNVDSVSFFYNDGIKYLEPLAFINGTKVDLECAIKENDEVDIAYPKTIGDFKKYYLTENHKLAIGDSILEDSYIISEGDRIKDFISPEVEIIEEEVENEEAVSEETVKEISAEETHELPQGEDVNDFLEIDIIVNGKPVRMKGKKEYIFIDIFERIDFDMTYTKGILVLELNGEKAGYHDKLKSGDIIKADWE